MRSDWFVAQHRSLAAAHTKCALGEIAVRQCDDPAVIAQERTNHSKMFFVRLNAEIQDAGPHRRLIEL